MSISGSQEKSDNYSAYDKTITRKSPIDICFVAEPAEVFNLREDAKIWAYSETKKRQSNASVTGLTEVLPFW